MNAYPGPNSVMILDNCSTHNSIALHEAVEAAGTSTFSIPLLSISHLLTSLLSGFQPHRGELQLL